MHFQAMLNEAGFNPYKVVNEWSSFRKYVSCSLKCQQPGIVQKDIPVQNEGISQLVFTRRNNYHHF